MSAKAKRHERTASRREALQVMYQGDILGESAEKIVTEALFLSEGSLLSDYACTLIRVFEEHREAIDEHLKSTSENWTLERMPVVDRSILRLATCEMIYIEDVPLSVTINEAVELAKDFGGEDDSSRFVNGVLGRIARSLEEIDPAKGAASSDKKEAAFDKQAVSPACEEPHAVKEECSSDKGGSSS